jgi:spore cortex formation protein SpoVR/YcgB (stage V sporulation)
MASKSPQAEVDRNYEEFKKLLPDLLKSYPGKYVVIHSGELSETFDTFGDAVRFGVEKFGKEKFSVQEITNQNVSLGFHSYALYQHSN